MAFSIKNAEADHLARALASLTGESLTTAVTESLRERLDRERRRRGPERRDRIAARIARFRDLDTGDRRSTDEILGYDRHGLPW